MKKILGICMIIAITACAQVKLDDTIRVTTGEDKQDPQVPGASVPTPTAGDTTTTGPSTVSSPVSAADGWTYAGTESAVPFACSDSEEVLKQKKVTHVAQGNAVLYIGYQQVSANNQDPRVARFDNGKQSWCRTDLEVTDDDSKGYGLLWNGGDGFFAVFSSTGTQGQPAQDFRRFATGGWLKSYGPGGGAKVAILAKLNADNGEPLRATFLSAYLESKKIVNTLVVTQLQKNTSGGLGVSTKTAYAPRRSDTNVMTCTAYPANYQLTFSEDLDKVTEAKADNCQ